MKDHMENSVQYHLDLVGQHSAKLTERLTHAEQAAEVEKKTVIALQGELSQVTTRVEQYVDINRAINERFTALGASIGRLEHEVGFKQLLILLRMF